MNNGPEILRIRERIKSLLYVEHDPEKNANEELK